MKKWISLVAVLVGVAVIAAPNGYFKANSDGTIDVVATEAEVTTVTASGTITADTFGGGMTTEAGSGILSATGEVIETAIIKNGDIYITTILIDVTGLNSSAADDIIGDDGATNCYVVAYEADESGTAFAGTVTCLEAPATGEPDIDIYMATESTGIEDTAITGLAETKLLDAGADWAITAAVNPRPLSALPTDGKYIYLVGSGDGTDATYTAGKFLITIYGL